MDPIQAEATIPTAGRVKHLEVLGDNIMFSVDEPIYPDQADITVGTVHLLNKADMTTIPLKVSYLMLLFAL